MTGPTLDMLQFVHLEKVYGHLPGLAESLPGIFKLSEEEYDQALHAFDQQARTAAEELLAEPEVPALVESLPFRAGHRVLAVGDSITDDLSSWAEILRHLLLLVRPADEVAVINAGLSAHTTAMVLRRWPATLMSRPDVVICALGGNDVTRVGPEARKTQVSRDESLANLGELRRIAQEACDPAWLWITPAPVEPDRAAAFAGFQLGQSSWDNGDVAALAARMPALSPDPVVDLGEVFGVPARGDLQGPDGVHPSIRGQQAITRAVLRAVRAPASARNT